MSDRWIAPRAILLFPFLAVPDKKGKYSGLFILDPNDKTVKKAIDEASEMVMALAEDEWGGKAAKLIKEGRIRLPFKRGWEKYSYPLPKDAVGINAKSKYQPAVVYPWAGPDGKLAPIPEAKLAEEIYSGVIVRASFRPYAYSADGNEGIAFGLGNIQKLEDGPRIATSTPDDEFSAVTERPAAPDDADGLPF